MQRLTPYCYSSDKRGSLTGITQMGWAEVNIVETQAHEKRGGHYHKETTELFYIVSGEVDVSVDTKLGQKLNFTVTKGDIFIVEPFELHTLYTKSNSVWLNMLSKAMDPAAPDFHTISA